MATRADRFTIKTKQIEVYSDFYISFDLNPITGFLARLTNEDAVKQSLKTLILTQRGERFYDPSAGSVVHSMLFEPNDDLTSSRIQTEILETIRNNEPRVQNLSVKVNPDEDAGLVAVTIYYEVINIPNQTFSLELNLERVR